MNKTLRMVVMIILIIASLNVPRPAVTHADSSVTGTVHQVDLEPPSTLLLSTVVTGLSREDSKPPVAPLTTPRTPQDIAKELVRAQWGMGEWNAFDTIVKMESGWNPSAVNKSSGACGLPQALPCSKIQDHSVHGQLVWMVNYIVDRYGTPSRALQWHMAHNWY